MPDWPVEKLGDLVDASRGISYGIVQPGEHQPDGVPIIRVSDLKGDVVEIGKPLRVAPSIEAAHSRTRLRGGELIMSIVGTVGQTAIVDPSLEGWNVARAVAVIPVKRDIGPYWIRLALKGGPARAHIQDRLNTTVQATLNLRDLASLPIVVPPAPEREAIAATLGALDDKIELNRKMNATLESMARALFRDWFVDFGPTRAKMEARPPYLSPDLWSLFPDRLDDEGKPEGWEVSTIGDEVRVVGGSTPSTKDAEFWDGGINWATPKDLSNLAAPVLLETSRTISQAGLAKISSGLLPAGTLLLSSRAPIGYIAIAEVPVAINQGFIGMICEKRVSNVVAWLWTLENMAVILAKANGSTFQEISKGNFRPLPVVVAPEPVLRAFDVIAKPLYERIARNERETRTLAQTRDLLLPRLMSGELRVAEAERLVGEVV
jgi:type I restriction enzyme S subunit